MLAFEDGPLDVFLELRLWAGAKLETHVYPGGATEVRWEGESFLAQLLICPLCSSVWLAAPFAVWAVGPGLDAFVAWLAVSGAASLAELISYKE